MSIITISRASCSDGQALADLVAERLGYRCLGSEALIEAAATYGVAEPKLSQAFEEVPSFWERLTQSRHQYLSIIQAAMCDQALEGALVYHGQAGQQLLKGISHVLKVRLIAPLAYRLKIAMEQLGVNRETALQHLQQADEEQFQRMRYLFNVDWQDPTLYDLVLNLEHMRLETAADVVVYMAQHADYQPTPVSEKTLHELTLSCRVRASLAVRGADVETRADGSIVWVTGRVPSYEAKFEALRVAQAVPGVNEVISEIEVTATAPYPTM